MTTQIVQTMNTPIIQTINNHIQKYKNIKCMSMYMLTNEPTNQLVIDLIDNLKIKLIGEFNVSSYGNNNIFILCLFNQINVSIEAIQFINKYINPTNIIILIVAKKFNFDNFIRNTSWDCIDAISWNDNMAQYVIIMRKE